MNKIKLFAVAIFASLLTTMSYAIETRLGASAAYVMFESDGSETLRQSSNVTNHTEKEEVLVPSLFLEIVNDSGVGLGVDYVPVAELGEGTGADDDAETSGANKASAELASHVTVYVIGQNDAGVFFKAGMAFADVDTTETLATGDSYGNATTEGLMIAAGKVMDRGTHFYRGEVAYTNYDEVSITSTGGSTVKASVDSLAFKLSVGKAF